ncbi:MAG: hypothetical protein KDH20_15910 [Rhodocyclaceae bacterium]|nr:hypothetical protein [Rhodocyclaceae bacterium]
MMAFEHCAHGEPITGHCPQCTAIGLANAHPARLNECWSEHRTGQPCPYPGSKTQAHCAAPCVRLVVASIESEQLGR